tara:strand:+ start:273 stop:449 length:177 start_codon:yes stop_codon:yes gene_type:complete
MDKKDKDKSDEITAESLEELTKRLGIKMLPDDHPLYSEPPTIILNPSIKKPKNKNKGD